MMSGPPPNPRPGDADISALLSGVEFEAFKSRLAFFLKSTGYERYEVGGQVVWAKSTEALVGYRGDIKLTETRKYRRGDRIEWDVQDGV